MELKEKYGLKTLFDDVEWRPLPAVVAVAMDAPRPLIHHSVFAQDNPFPEVRDGFRGSRRVLPDPAWKLNAVGLARDQVFDPHGRPPRLLHRTAIFRDGVVEWARRYSNDAYTIPSTTFAEDVHDVLKYIATVFASVDYFGRVAIFVRIENAEQATLGVGQGYIGEPAKAEVEWLGAYAETPVDDLLVDPTPVVRDAMDMISQGFGFPRSPCFHAETGDWRV